MTKKYMFCKQLINNLSPMLNMQIKILSFNNAICVFSIAGKRLLSGFSNFDKACLQSGVINLQEVFKSTSWLLQLSQPQPSQIPAEAKYGLGLNSVMRRQKSEPTTTTTTAPKL